MALISEKTRVSLPAKAAAAALVLAAGAAGLWYATEAKAAHAAQLGKENSTEIRQIDRRVQYLENHVLPSLQRLERGQEQQNEKLDRLKERLR